MKNKIFICLFFCISLIPLLTTGLFKTTTEQTANQILTEVPSFVDETGNININYLSEFSNYFDDHIGLRNQLISTEHGITAALFGESSEEKVILGKNGWLFYKDTLADYQRTNLLSDRELYSVTRTIYLMQEFCENNNINFAFTIVPNKNSLYGNNMPSYYRQGTGKSNLEMFSEEANSMNINYIDLLSVFNNSDKVLYRKTDSHWTNEGAGLAADIILKSVDKNVPLYFGSQTETVQAQTGDLFEMLYPSQKDKDIDIVYKNNFSFKYEKPIRSVEDNFIRTICDGKNGNLYVFRDSFGNTLYPYLAENFGKSVFTRLFPYNLTLPLSENADTVIIEIVERNISWLIEKPPVFPSPERLISSLQNYKTLKNVEISTSESLDLEGYIKLECKYSEIEKYNHNIYIQTGAKTFEAIPNGSNKFTAFLPASSDLTNLKVLTGK